jgi:hypothetical protein
MTKNQRQGRSHFVPKAVFKVTFMAVVPACAVGAVACSSSVADVAFDSGSHEDGPSVTVAAIGFVAEVGFGPDAADARALGDGVAEIGFDARIFTVANLGFDAGDARDGRDGGVADVGFGGDVAEAAFGHDAADAHDAPLFSVANIGFDGSDGRLGVADVGFDASETGPRNPNDGSAG